MAQPDRDAGAPLQPFASELSTYERVEQLWVCGRRAQGRPCGLGPDRRGQCSLKRAGARTASKLDDDAVPCRPRRSTRARRGLFTRVSVLMVAGALVTALASGWNERLISPGELSGMHQHIQDCARCHAGDDTGLQLPGLSTGKAGCLGCHQFASDEHFGAPHSMPPAELTERTRRTSAEPAGPAPPGMRIAALFAQEPEVVARSCKQCHREHGGSEASPVAVDDTSCQTCHVRKFRSFERGHPEFQHFPHHDRRTLIAFDHGVHYREWFRDSTATSGSVAVQATRSCSTCHTVEPDGRVMRILGFDAMCADCHADDVSPIAARPVVLLAVPAPEREPETEPAPELAEEPGPPAAGEELVARLLRTIEDDDAALADALVAGLNESLGFDVLTRDEDPPTSTRDRSREIAAAQLTSDAPWAALGLAENLMVDIRQSDGAPGVLRLVYRSRGHGDEILENWLPLMLDPVGADQIGAILRSGPSMLTACLKCHTAARDPGGNTRIHWKGRNSRSSARNDLVGFTHAPHLRETQALSELTEVLDADPCTFCHVLPSRDEIEGWLPANPNLFVLDDGVSRWQSPLGDFQAMEKGICRTCHNDEGAAATCLTCHRYHAGERSLVPGSTPR